MGKNGTGENQHNTVFIALTIGKEMEFVPILSYVHVKLWLLNSTKKISTINKIKLFLNTVVGETLTVQTLAVFLIFLEILKN